MNFTYFYKQRYASLSAFNPEVEYDYYISTYNYTDRVKYTADKIMAKHFIWITLPEYQNDVLLTGKEQYSLKGTTDYEGMRLLCNLITIKDNSKICIDSTGFLVPHLLILLRCLRDNPNHPIVDIIYTEADRYIHAEQSVFSESFTYVSQVDGYEGKHVSKMESDLMIIASGYDHSRIRDVASYKKRASKVQMIGFPSIKADMFQENILAASSAELFSVCPLNNCLFAPAYDPFVTAQIIKDYIDRQQRVSPITNIYLAPLSSKPQALGMALYYIWENGIEKPMSIIYPQCEKYIQDNAVGTGGVWLYKSVL